MPDKPSFVYSLWRSLRHRNYKLYLTGQLVSLCGTWMQQVAQSWLVYRLTDSATLLGAVGFASQIPVFALGPIGGGISRPLFLPPNPFLALYPPLPSRPPVA